MSVSACPIGEVAAPADRVWSFLSEPRRLDLWWDARVVRAEPDGPMAAGQHIEATARGLGRTFVISFDVVEVDVAQRRLRITAHLPLGITDHATLTVTPLDGKRSRL